MIQHLFPRYHEIHAHYFELGKKIAPADMLKADKNGTFNRTGWRKAGKGKLHGLPALKKELGNHSAALETCAAFEGFAKGCTDNGLNFSIGAHLLAGVIPIYMYGSQKQKTGFLPELILGNHVIANAITEKKSGSDVFSMEGFAAKKGKDYIINAEKVYITNAPVADFILVYVMTDKKKGFFGGVSAFIIPAKTKGVEISGAKEKMGLRTCPMGFVNFRSVKINESFRIGEEGAGAQMFSDSMVWERTVLSAMTLGHLERVFETTVNFCKQRTIGDKKLIQLTNMAHWLAEIKTNLSAARLLVYDAALAIDEGKRDSLLKSSIAKSFVSEKGVEAVRILQGMYGAAGYLSDTGIEREYRDMYASLIYSGTTAVQKNIIAGNL